MTNVQGVQFGPFGSRNDPKVLGIIEKMSVSSDGKYLAVLDQNAVAAVYSADMQNFTKPVAFSELRQPPTYFCVLSHPVQN